MEDYGNQNQQMNQTGTVPPHNQGGGYQQQDPNKAVMSMGEWLITLLVSMIPCVGLIMLFVWGFGDGNENRKNFCRAQLILQAIAIVFTIFIYIFFFAAIISSIGSLSNYGY